MKGRTFATPGSAPTFANFEDSPATTTCTCVGQRPTPAPTSRVSVDQIEPRIKVSSSTFCSERNKTTPLPLAPLRVVVAAPSTPPRPCWDLKPSWRPPSETSGRPAAPTRVIRTNSLRVFWLPGVAFAVSILIESKIGGYLERAYIYLYNTQRIRVRIPSSPPEQLCPAYLGFPQLSAGGTSLRVSPSQVDGVGEVPPHGIRVFG